MQTRDYYIHDYSMKYYPKIDLQTFQSDLYTQKKGRLDTVVYDEEDLKQDVEIYQFEKNT